MPRGHTKQKRCTYTRRLSVRLVLDEERLGELLAEAGPAALRDTALLGTLMGCYGGVCDCDCVCVCELGPASLGGTALLITLIDCFGGVCVCACVCVCVHACACV